MDSTTETASTPTVTIAREKGDEVDVWLKFRGLKHNRPGFFERLFRRTKSGPHPGHLLKNGTIQEWTLTPNSLIVRLTVGVKEGQSKPSKSRDQPEDFYFEIKQFPCAISVADTTYDVKETRNNSSFIILSLKKIDAKVNWMEFQRREGSLDANPEDPKP